MKNGININDRLTATLSFVEKCTCIADIGSDHGYSSIYMIKNGIAQNVIATDISVPSLAKTEKLVLDHGLTNRISCRVGDGLKVIKPGEADAVLIAGMGAELISEIISSSADVARLLKFMVLQPMNSAEPLRRHLSEHGYDIIEEGITFDNGKFYQILKCRYGTRKDLMNEEYEIGTFVYKNKIPLCKEFVEYKIRKYEQILSYIGNNDDVKRQDLTVLLDRCRKVLRWINAE